MSKRKLFASNSKFQIKCVIKQVTEQLTDSKKCTGCLEMIDQKFELRTRAKIQSRCYYPGW